MFAVCAAAGMVAGIVLPSVPIAAAGALLCAFAASRVQREFMQAQETTPVALVESPPAVPSACAAPPMAPSIQRVPPVLEPDAVIAALGEATAHIAEVVATHLWLTDDATATLRLLAASGCMAPSAQPTPLTADDVLAHAATSRCAEFGTVARMRLHGEPQTVWRYALPVAAAEAHGVAAVDFRSVEPPDISALPQITAPLRGALSGALGMHVARVELDTARHLIEAARDLSRILDPDEVLVAALHRAMSLSAAETGSVMLLDPATGRLEIKVAEGLPAEVVHATSVAEGEGIAGWVLAAKQPMLIEDLPARTPTARRHGIRSAASVPIADDEGILGVLNVGSRSFPARFTESHLASIEVIGKQAATALRNAQAVEQSRELYFDTLKALAVALETKDPYSKGCTDRVLDLAEALGSVFGLPTDERHALRVAALLHDIGMAAAGDGVLTSDRPLTTVERALLKMHPQIASEILAEVPALKRVVPIVYHHHEWYDGQGYLDGMAGEGIPLGSRILAVADAFVAMTSSRPYRDAYSEKEAMRELTEKAGTQFDPAVVDALKDILSGGPNRVPGSSGGRA